MPGEVTRRVDATNRDVEASELVPVASPVAGARTVIMSLWSVEDQSTTHGMRALYEARLVKKMGTVSAKTLSNALNTLQEVFAE